jgi:hypothetical protein
MVTKMFDDSVMDAALDVIETADGLSLCEDMPASYAEATTAKGSGGKKLGDDSPGAFTQANGDVSGRKTTMAAVAGVAVDVTGAWDYIALTKAAGSVLVAALPLSNAPITAIDQGTKTITVTGDVSAVCIEGKVVTVRDSTGNDGVYIVVSSSYGAPSTAVVVEEALASATADGILIYGAQSVTSGNTATVNETKVDEIRDPA